MYASTQITAIDTHRIEEFIPPLSITDVATNIIDGIYDKKKKRNIWENSAWAHIAELENDDVGKAGERLLLNSVPFVKSPLL